MPFVKCEKSAQDFGTGKVELLHALANGKVTKGSSWMAFGTWSSMKPSEMVPEQLCQLSLKLMEN